MVKRISDQERLEYVKKYKKSGLSVSEFGELARFPYAYFLKKL